MHLQSSRCWTLVAFLTAALASASASASEEAVLPPPPPNVVVPESVAVQPLWVERIPDASRWYAGIEVLWLSRDYHQNAPLAQTVVLDPNFKPVPLPGAPFITLGQVTDASFQPGLHVWFGFRFANSTSIELGYFGLQQWSAAATLPVGDPPFANSPFLGSAIIFGNKSFDTSITVRYNSAIHSSEANLRHSFSSGNWTAAALGGFRYFKLSEQFSLTGLQTFPNIPGGAPPASQTIVEQTRASVNNNLFGAQIGGELGRAWFDDRFTLAVNGKVGLFANDASQFTTNGARLITGGGVGTTTLAAGSSSTSFASLYEGGITATGLVTSRIAVRAGYQALFVQGLAMAPSQLAKTGTAIQKSSMLVPGSFVPSGVPVPPQTLPPPGTGAGAESNGNLLLHGPFVGLEFRY